MSADERELNSPLQKLTRKILKEENEEADKWVGGADTLSLYSFDSVSTSSRLLDRLGLDEDERLINGFNSDIRGTGISLPLEYDRSNTRIDPKLGLLSATTSRFGAKSQDDLRDEREKNISNSLINGLNVKRGPVSSFIKNKNVSVDSLRADIGTMWTGTPSRSSSRKTTNGASNHAHHFSFSKDILLFPKHNGSFQKPPNVSKDFAREDSLLESASIPENNSCSSSRVTSVKSNIEIGSRIYDNSTLSVPNSFETEDDGLLSRSSSTDNFAHKVVLPDSNRRIASDPALFSDKEMHTSDDSQTQLERKTKLAGELRRMGKYREASYQLKLAADLPNSYPKAMYLYAIALKLGQGVKQNDRHAVKWLCKCILATTVSSKPEFIAKVSSLEPESLIKYITQRLQSERIAEPSELYEYYSKLEPSQLSKLINNSKSHMDVVAAAYHELGNFLLNKWGFRHKEEMLAIEFLSKAGSMGNANSMVQLGEIWSSKSKHHKKDNYKAASWFRLGEVFGVKTIGNSWIYKEKYMTPKKKN